MANQIQVRLNPDVPPTGSDLSIVNAARRSFNTRSEWTPESQCPTDPITGGKIPPYKRLKDKDKRLLQFLARGMTADAFEGFCSDIGGSEDWYSDMEDLKRLLWQWRNTPTHDTPFNHTFISFEVKAPIFVRAQLVKHEYLIMSEFSRRYIKDEIEYYSPESWRLKPEGSVKQGSGASTRKPEYNGTGYCHYCGGPVGKPSAGPRGKWCSEKCRSYWRKENVPDDRLAGVKSNAKKRGIPFELSKGDIDWPTICPALKVELDYKTGNNTRYSPSVDRITNSKGYTKDNVEVLSLRANAMKADASKEELIQFAKWVLLRYGGYKVPEGATYDDAMDNMIDFYHNLIEQGYAPEMARMVLPQSTMTEWTWSGTLGAFAKMCQLRLHPEAQYEARLVAQQVYEYLKEYWPIGAPALVEGPDV